MKRVGIYTRISLDKDGRETATERQEKDCRAEAKRRGWKIVEVYTDRESAYSGKHRPEYERMLDDLASGAIDGVLFWRFDRLVRRITEFSRFWDACRSRDAFFASATQPIDSTSAIGLGVVYLLVAVAQQESENISLRVARKSRDRAERGLSRISQGHNAATGRTTRAFGWKEDWRTLKKDEAKHLKTAATRILQGDSLLGVVKEWNEKGVKTTRNGAWTPRSLKLALISPRIAGLVQYQGEVLRDEDGNEIEGEWEPILDRDTWQLVVHKLTDPSRRHVFTQGKRIYLLTSGLSTCGVCGGSLRAKPRKHDGGRTYECGSGKRCGVTTSAEPLEDFVRDALFAAIKKGAIPKALRKATGDDARDRAAVEELRSVEAMMEKLDDDYYGGQLGEQRYRRQVDRLQRRVGELQSQLRGNGHARIVVDLPKGEKALRQAWEERGIDWRRALVRSLIEQVVVHPRKDRRNELELDKIELVWRV